MTKGRSAVGLWNDVCPQYPKPSSWYNVTANARAWVTQKVARGRHVGAWLEGLREFIRAGGTDKEVKYERDIQVELDRGPTTVAWVGQFSAAAMRCYCPP